MHSQRVRKRRATKSMLPINFSQAASTRRRLVRSKRESGANASDTDTDILIRNIDPHRNNYSSGILNHPFHYSHQRPPVPHHSHHSSHTILPGPTPCCSVLFFPDRIASAGLEEGHCAEQTSRSWHLQQNRECRLSPGYLRRHMAVAIVFAESGTCGPNFVAFGTAAAALLLDCESLKLWVQEGVLNFSF